SQRSDIDGWQRLRGWFQQHGPTFGVGSRSEDVPGESRQDHQHHAEPKDGRRLERPGAFPQTVPEDIGNDAGAQWPIQQDIRQLGTIFAAPFEGIDAQERRYEPSSDTHAGRSLVRPTAATRRMSSSCSVRLAAPLAVRRYGRWRPGLDVGAMSFFSTKRVIAVYSVPGPSRTWAKASTSHMMA